MKRLLKLLALIGVVGGVCGLFVSYLLFAPLPDQKNEVRLIIEKGQRLDDISELLQRKGIIRSATAFKAYMKIRYPLRTVKAGEYSFKRLSVPDIAHLIVAGIPRAEVAITLIEGWTAQEMQKYLVSKGFAFTKKSFGISADLKNRYPFLARLSFGRTLEGYLFPDTYHVYADAGEQEIISKILDTFDAKMAPEFLSRKNRKLGFDDAIILASIIEKEVRSDDDRKKVADLFLRRLEVGMPLQADSTVNYVTEKRTPAISVKDTQINSPYNTYRHKGLPPGPIGNPGLSSLQAVFSPTPNPFWFFLTTPQGMVIYSTTFEEHVRNKRKYL